jgi:hypothetical protein
VLDVYDLEIIKQLVVYTQNRGMAGIGDLASPIQTADNYDES